MDSQPWAGTASKLHFRHGTELSIPIAARLGVWIDPQETQ